MRLPIKAQIRKKREMLSHNKVCQSARTFRRK